VVVEQDDVGRLAGHVGAGHAHGDADVGGFQGRRIVHAIAGHRHDFVLVLHGFDNAHLLVGGNAGEQDFRRVQRQLQARRTHLPHRLAQYDDRRGIAHQADFTREGQGRVRMVAGDHDDAYPGLSAARHCLAHVGARRVFEADEAAQVQA
jgi:hypothetical protein